MIKKLSESSLPIAISAFGITIFYSEMLAQNSDILRALLNFCSTFFMYNLAILTPKLLANQAEFFKSKYHLSLSLAALFVLLPLIYCLRYLGALDIINYSHLFILSLLYELPGKYKLRSIAFFKPFLISYIWTMSVVAPYYYDNIISPSPIFIIEFFVFMMLLCLIFDYRDIETDEKEGIKTFANQIGLKGFKVILYTLFSLSTLLTLFVFCKTVFFILNIIAIFLVILKLDKNKSYFFYLIVVDGLILLRVLNLLNF